MELPSERADRVDPRTLNSPGNSSTRDHLPKTTQVFKFAISILSPNADRRLASKIVEPS